MIIRQSLGKNFDALTLGKLETTSSLPSKLNFPTHPFKQLDWFPEFSQDLKSRMLSDDALERRRKGGKKKKKNRKRVVWKTEAARRERKVAMWGCWRGWRMDFS